MNTRGKRHTWYITSLAAFVAAALVLAAGPALGITTRYAIDDPSFNPGGPTMPYTWTLYKQVVGNNPVGAGSPQVLTWCSGLSPYDAEASGTFADWEGSLSGTQFTQDCSANNIYVAWDPGSVCPDGYYACVITSCSGCWQWDGTRSAYYLHGAIIYLKTSIPSGWTTLKVRQTLRHELGHVMGLGEWYLNNGASCNPNSPSTIMDLAPDAVFGCGNGSVVTSADNTSVGTTLYGFTTVSGVVGWNCSAYYPTKTLCVNWTDNEPANSLMYADYWRCTNSSCSGGSTYLGSQVTVAGSGYYNSANSTSKSNLTAGYYYWAGISHNNAVKGYGPTTYTAIVSIP